MFQEAFKDTAGPQGEVWTTYSDIGQYRFGIVFAADLKQPFSLTPDQTSFAENVSVKTKILCLKHVFVLF